MNRRSLLKTLALSTLVLPRRAHAVFPGLLAVQHGNVIPFPTTNLQLWLDPTQETAYSDGDDVTTAHDWSGNSKNWTGGGGAPVNANNPKWRNASVTINSKPVFSFLAAANPFFKILQSSFDTSAWTAATVFIVAKNDADPATGAGDDGLWTLNNGFDFNTHHPFTDGVVYNSTFSTVRKTVGNPTPSLASPWYATMISGSGVWTERLNGTQIFTTGTNTYNGYSNSGTPHNYLAIGNSSDSFQYNGVIGDIIMYNAVLSGADIATVESYLASKWAI